MTDRAVIIRDTVVGQVQESLMTISISGSPNIPAGETYNINGSPHTHASSAMQFLEQHTASGSATLDFTNWYSSVYDDYIIECISLIPVTNSVDLWLRMSIDGGSSYDTGTNYVYQFATWGTSSFSNVNATGAVKIILSQLINNTANYGYNGSLKLFNPGSALYKSVMYDSYGAAAGGYYNQRGGGMYLSTSAVNALRFLMSSGNISSGTIRIYGVVNS